VAIEMRELTKFIPLGIPKGFNLFWWRSTAEIYAQKGFTQDGDLVDLIFG